MAWTKINHSCGHTDSIQLYGPGRDRERKAAWLEGKDCPACAKTRRDAENAALAEAAKDKNAGLPALTGSDKQIPWAETIRAAATDLLLEVMSKAKPEHAEAVADAVRLILAQSSAKYWIDNRDRLSSAGAVAGLIREMVLARRAREEGAKTLEAGA